MEFIRYIFGDLWHFVGFVIVLCIALSGITDIIKAIKR